MSRTVREIIRAERHVEGAGFVVRRPFPIMKIDHVDPFLLIDEMGPMDKPFAGAPDHPHRGFETVTYILEGEGAHEDSAGHRGVIGPGDVQWMTAGSGVIHSEMPSERMQREGGRMHGFQIWVNLPARDKMMAPRYQEIPSAKIPSATSRDGFATVRVIAGEALGANAVIETRTPILYHHWNVSKGASVDQALDPNWNVMAYVWKGAVLLGDDRREVKDGELAILTAGDRLHIEGTDAGAEFLLLGGQPLREPVARYGPFVMNTRAEIMQAVEDFQSGRFGSIQRSETQHG